MKTEELKSLVVQTLSVLMDEYAIPYSNMTDETVVYGTRDGISSLMLVRLIVDLEEALEIHTGQTITIADEKILSAENSPFANIGTLTQYIFKLVDSGLSEEVM